MKNVEIFDDFLKYEDFFKVKSLLMGDTLPWYYNSYKSRKDETLKEQEVNNIQFIHNFYENLQPVSPFISTLEPLINTINPISVVRIKANLNPVTSERVVYGFHNDFDIETAPLKTAVFYVNTNNGATVFKNGEEVVSKENRLVVFDSHLVHAGTSCTDEKTRVLLNLNFIKW